MVTVSGMEAVTLPLPDGVVPLPVMVTVTVPGAAVVKPLDPPHDVTASDPRPSASKAHRLHRARALANRFRANNRSTPAMDPGMSRPARRRLDFPAGTAPTIVVAAVLMVMVPCA